MTARNVEKVVVVHPDDMNLADAKAMAAKYDTSVVGNPYCPRGKAFLMDMGALGFPHTSPGSKGSFT